MEFRILGPIEAVHDGAPVALGGPRQRALLAALLVEHGRVVSAERLADLLWEGAPPPGAAGTLRAYVSKLRSAVGDAVEGRPPGYVLSGGDVDAARFEVLTERARAAAVQRDWEQASDLLHEALALWRGPALAEVPAMHAEAARLEGLRAAALEDRIEADLQLGRHEEVLPELEALLAADPLQERLWGALMLALYRCGRQADALAAFQRARAILDEELGLEPTPDLRALEQQILIHEVPEPAVTEAGNLPAAISTFVGRERELSDLEEMLASARLVTLAGIGGAGKTRLALEAAGRARFADGAWLVELAGTAEPVSAAATAIGVADRPERPLEERLADRVRSARMLIVLDNCEHVLAGAARLAALLLRAGPQVTVVATSREPLGVTGERVYLVPPLSDGDARTLLADRAPAHRRALVTGDAVGRLCRALDDLPLAIELAAARLAVLTPEDMVARLDDRLRFLRSEHAEERHQTLEAMIDWSHALLEPGERVLLARLSAFSGGWTLDAAQAVWDGDVLDPLDRLVRASLVVADGARFRMLETVRRYAAERLAESGEADDAAHRHASHFAARADAAWEAWDTPGQVDEDRRLWAEVDNLRAALAYPDPVIAGRVARGFAHIGRIHGLHDEVHARTSRALAALAEEETELRADLTGLLGYAAVRRSDFAAAIGYFEQAVELARGRSLGRHAYGLGYALTSAGDRERAGAAHRAAVEAFREAGDPGGAAWSLGALGDLAMAAGRLDEAAALHDEERPLVAASGSAHLMMAHLGSAAELELQRGSLEVAADLARESLALAETHGDPVYTGLMHHLLAFLARRAGDVERAREHLRQGLSSLRTLESGLAAAALETLAGVELDGGRPEAAARVLACADALRERSGAPADPSRLPVVEADRAAVRAALGDAGFESATRAGRLITLDQAVQLAG